MPAYSSSVITKTYLRLILRRFHQSPDPSIPLSTATFAVVTKKFHSIIYSYTLLCILYIPVVTRW